MTGQGQALTDEEYDHMAAVLHRFHSERAMNLEMLDGFFVALICSPDMVPPSEYLRRFGEERWLTTRYSGMSGSCKNSWISSCAIGIAWRKHFIQKTSSCRCSSKTTTALPTAMTGPTASLAAWRCGAIVGLNFLTIRSTPARLYPFSRLHMNIIPIRRCVLTKSQ